MRPTLIQKRRYIIFNVSKRIEDKTMINEIEKTVLKFSGQYGSAKAGCQLVDFNGNWGILRADLDQVDAVKTAMLYIEEIQGKKVNFKFPYVAGTIKSAREFIIKKGGR